jgi:hypothetical protein
MSIADPNKTILTGESPFIRLSLKDVIRTQQMRAIGGLSFRQLGPATSST